MASHYFLVPMDVVPLGWFGTQYGAPTCNRPLIRRMLHPTELIVYMSEITFVENFIEKLIFILTKACYYLNCF